MRAVACWAVCLVAPRRGVAAGVAAPLPRRPLGAGDRAVLAGDSPCKARAVSQHPQHIPNSVLVSQVSSDAHTVCLTSVCSSGLMLLACCASQGQSLSCQCCLVHELWCRRFQQHVRGRFLSQIRLPCDQQSHFGAMPTNICRGSCTLPCSSRGLPRPHGIGVAQSCQRLCVALGISSSLRCLHLVCFATLMQLLRAMRKNCTCCVLRPDLPKASPKVACLPRADSGAVGGREPALPCPADAG